MRKKFEPDANQWFEPKSNQFRTRREPNRPQSHTGHGGSQINAFRTSSNQSGSVHPPSLEGVSEPVSDQCSEKNKIYSNACKCYTAIFFKGVTNEN